MIENTDPKQALVKTDVISSFFMYKVVSECNNNEVWESGFYSKEKANIEDYSQRDTDVPHKTKK